MTAPVFPTSITLIYYDQRIWPEGFDVEWMMDAPGMMAQVPTQTIAAGRGNSGGGDPAMRFAHFRSCAILGLAICFAAKSLRAQTLQPPTSQTSIRSNDVSIDGYAQHIVRLESIVEGCSQRRDLKTCDPALIGPDDRVSITIGAQTEPRLIRYDWLRAVFMQAQKPDEDSGKAVAAKQGPKQVIGLGQNDPSTLDLLKDAKARLERDLAQSRAPLVSAPDHAREHAVMREVLAGPEFRNLQQSTMKDSILEKFARWLNHLFASAANLKARFAWVGRVLVWGFVLGVCVALTFALLRLERRWRVRLTPDDDERPAPGAASARDWQLWLEDARRAASTSQWREAIHLLYWAAISRLESRRLWPADRARTPREYLALVAQEDPRKSNLSELTNTFERFWYGGRPAAESDYTAAESLAASLIGVRSNSIAGPNAASSEGGSR
jgi:hypothetical protein